MRVLVLIINRMMWFVPTLIGLMIITFTISHIIPADPVAFFAGEKRNTLNKLKSCVFVMGSTNPFIFS